MQELIDTIFVQYTSYASVDITLEITAVIFGFLSVWFAKQNNIWVFPTGLISTGIFVYLLFKWELLGDMMINAYYFAMSIYGWYIWTRKTNDAFTPISRTPQAACERPNSARIWPEKIEMKKVWPKLDINASKAPAPNQALF